MAKKETKKISIAITPEVEEKLNKGNFNCNKLVNQLLKEHLDKKDKK
jgi:hypothetical protein